MPPAGRTGWGEGAAPDGLTLLPEREGRGLSEAKSDGYVTRWRREEMVAARMGSQFSGTFTDVSWFPPKAGLTPCPFSSRYAPPPFRKG